MKKVILGVIASLVCLVSSTFYIYSHKKMGRQFGYVIDGVVLHTSQGTHDPRPYAVEVENLLTKFKKTGFLKSWRWKNYGSDDGQETAQVYTYNQIGGYARILYDWRDYEHAQILTRRSNVFRKQYNPTGVYIAAEEAKWDYIENYFEEYSDQSGNLNRYCNALANSDGKAVLELFEQLLNGRKQVVFWTELEAREILFYFRSSAKYLSTEELNGIISQIEELWIGVLHAEKQIGDYIYPNHNAFLVAYLSNIYLEKYIHSEEKDYSLQMLEEDIDSLKSVMDSESDKFLNRYNILLKEIAHKKESIL